MLTAPADWEGRIGSAGLGLYTVNYGRTTKGRKVPRPGLLLDIRPGKLAGTVERDVVIRPNVRKNVWELVTVVTEETLPLTPPAA